MDEQPLTLTIKAYQERLEVLISNQSNQPIRVWERNNPWGWETILLSVSATAEAGETVVLRPKPIIWTRTGPVFLEIPGGDNHRITLTCGDPEWEHVEQVEHLRHSIFYMAATLHVPPSAEADIYEVFTGELKSSWIESVLPHVWLFGN